MAQPQDKRKTTLVIALAVVGALALLAAFAGSIVYLVTTMMRSSEPYQVALRQARADPKVAEELGSPLEEGFFAQGSISTTNDSGSAELAIPVSGPKGSGVVEVAASRSAGVWTLQHVLVRVEGSGKELPLGGAAPAEAEAPAR